MSRLAIAAALEALESGAVDYATAILLDALEDGPNDRPFRCRCGTRFQWPGLLTAHEDSGVCPLAWEKAA